MKKYIYGVEDFYINVFFVFCVLSFGLNLDKIMKLNKIIIV